MADQPSPDRPRVQPSTDAPEPHIHFALQDPPPHATNPGPTPEPTTSAEHPDITVDSVANTLPTSPAKPALRHATTYQTGDATAAGHSSHVSSPLLSPSVDAWSDFEVVLDDGTKQKRSVSLSTLPGQNFEDGNGTCAPECEHNEEDENDDHDGHNATTPLLRHRSSSAATGFSSDSDSDSEDSSTLFSHQPHRNARQHRHTHHHYTTPSRLHFTFPALTQSQKLIIKCALAYFIASLFTFVPQLNALIGNNKTSSHIVATATVFFNPAKTVGGMVEATGYGWAYTFFAICTCLGSMATTDWFYQHDMPLVGHAVSHVVWLGGSTFVVAFLKAKWNKPPVATASSLCFIIIFVIMVREGSTDRGEFSTKRIQEMAGSVIVGTLITVLVCLLVWPSMAGKKLKTDIGDTLTSFRILLKLLTKTFLLDSDLPEFSSNTALQKAIASHRATFTALQKSLHETRLEFIDRGMQSRIDGYDDAVKSLQRLAQHVGGLRSSCGLQFEMMHSSDARVAARNDDGAHTPSPPVAGTNALGTRPLGGVRNSIRRMARRERKETWGCCPGYIRRKMQDEIHREQSVRRTNATTSPTSPTIPRPALLVGDLVMSPTHSADQGSDSDEECDRPGALVEFIDSVGPPMKSLAYTCKRTLVHLQEAVTHETVRGAGESFYESLSFASWIGTGSTAESATDLLGGEEAARGGGARARSPVSFRLLQRNLTAALELFESSHRQAIARLYRRKMRLHRAKIAAEGGDIRTAVHREHVEGEENGPGEEVFLVYFFVFCLQEFAKELGVLVECIRRVCEDEEEEEEEEEEAEERLGWFAWMATCWGSRRRYAGTEETERIEEQTRRNIKRINSMWGGSFGNPSAPFRTTPTTAFFPNDRNMANTLQTPRPTTHLRAFFVRLWSFFSWFRRFTVRYAFKAAVAAVLMATPAFLEEWADLFLEYRMEWGLITLMVVMTPTVGGTNLVAVYRIASTILGCYVAAAVYILFPANMYVLPVFTFLFAIPNFYLILNSVHAKMGQFTLLAYNLVMLSGYNYRDDPTFDIGLLAWRRAVAVGLGVAAGVLVTNYVWPYEARVELRKGLSDLFLNLAWLYNKIVGLNSTLGASQQESDPNSHALSLLARPHAEFLDTELALQLALLQLHDLLSQTPNEPRLKGKFPVATYSQMLLSAQNILDKLLSMRIAILDEGWHTDVRREFIDPVNAQRRELAGSVLLYFYTLASALRLKTPLPPYLPPAMQAWKRQLERIRELPIVNRRSSVGRDEHYMFYYAYSVMMEDVVRELDKIGNNMRNLFGELVPSAEWEQYFIVRPEQGGDFRLEDGLVSPL